MKKFILTSAMALIGTFAFAANNLETEETQIFDFSKNCVSVTPNCGGLMVYCYEGTIDEGAFNAAVQRHCAALREMENW